VVNLYYPQMDADRCRL